jgi:hypothetical protein
METINITNNELQSSVYLDGLTLLAAPETE